MPKEKKKYVDAEGLGRLIGNFCFVMAGFLLALGLFDFLGYTWAGTITGVLMILSVIYILITAQKYDKTTQNPDGTMKTGVKLLMGLIIAFLLVVAALVGLGGNLPL